MNWAEAVPLNTSANVTAPMMIDACFMRNMS